ncbi:aminoglycoside phosphotransferase family protein [Sulfitobacter aestuariivivens]|uniref:Phosphotransferase n=1 Tax=Sulfitobacter aestuariivivens TaxID=2766981 RepID=A0A927D551_9RHOB|nr:phosphotransferase [Sulfitobacter aestuariivivens]MBD3665210.1 phosphotransferase [Sulfitobacter aestuariivivens]
MTDRPARLQAFIAQSGWSDSTRTLVAGDASNRRYDRLQKPDGSSAILMDAPPDKGENTQTFVRVAQYLTSIGLSAPKIYHEDPVKGFLLIEDLGTDRFAERIADNPSQEHPLYTAAIDALITLQRAEPISLEICGAAWLADAVMLAFDWYADSADAKTKDTFYKAFCSLARTLEDDRTVVILRDFHAENLLWLPAREEAARVGLLDFQDALLGHPAYDLVSILQDARRDVSPETEAAMITCYLDQTGLHPDRFRAAYALLGFQRNLRILGIFARLCLRDGKARYVAMIPRVHGYVMRNLEHPKLSELRSILSPHLPAPTEAFLDGMRRRCPDQTAP